MRDLMKEIKNYYEEAKGKEYITPSNSVDIAVSIMYYAHRNQTRLNGYYYACHPQRMGDEIFDRMFDKNNKVNHELLNYLNLPFYGVEEVCLLHDVIEDTDITIDDIKQIYYDLDYKYYYDKFIDKALRLITHNKKESYEIYINKLLVNPIASLVKLLDMKDNLNIFELKHLNKEDEERAIKYIHYYKVINDEWKFIENLNMYEKLKNKFHDKNDEKEDSKKN